MWLHKGTPDFVCVARRAPLPLGQSLSQGGQRTGHQAGLCKGPGQRRQEALVGQDALLGGRALGFVAGQQRLVPLAQLGKVVLPPPNLACRLASVAVKGVQNPVT